MMMRIIISSKTWG